jgi:hypothetical protein
VRAFQPYHLSCAHSLLSSTFPKHQNFSRLVWELCKSLESLPLKSFDAGVVLLQYIDNQVLVYTHQDRQAEENSPILPGHDETLRLVSDECTFQP